MMSLDCQGRLLGFNVISTAQDEELCFANHVCNFRCSINDSWCKDTKLHSVSNECGPVRGSDRGLKVDCSAEPVERWKHADEYK